MAATLIGLSGVVARAQTEEEISALLAEALLLPEWETLFTGTAGFGYTDNVFLSNVDPLGSPLVTASGEVFVMRLAPIGAAVSVYGNAEARVFFDKDVQHEEFTSFNQIEISGLLTEQLEGSLAARYFYQDQLVDVSATETNRQITPVLGHTFNLQPGLRFEFLNRTWIGMDIPVARQLLEEPLDDYWEGGGVFVVGQGYQRNSNLTLEYEPLWRSYDSDPARTASGADIPGSNREAFRQDTRFTWRHRWDEQKRWQTFVQVAGRINTENGGGFFDYRRGLVLGRLQYRVHDWEFSTEGRVAYYQYENQTATPTTTEKRERTEWTFRLEVGRRLAERLAWHVQYEYESVRSNDPLEIYDVNTVTSVVSVEF